MSGWREWTDAVDRWDADAIDEVQKQSVLYFATADARDAALTSDIRRRGMLTFCATEGTYEAWTGAAWAVVDSIPFQVPLSATVSTNASAALASSLAVVQLPAEGTYELEALLKVSSGTAKVTSLLTFTSGSASGYWFNSSNNEDAALFDQTSADATMNLAAGPNLLVGRVTVTAADPFTLYGYGSSGSTTIDAPSYLQVRRVA